MGNIFFGCFGDLFPKPAHSTDNTHETGAKVDSLNDGVDAAVDITPRSCFGAGCYWGTEKYLKHDFAKKCVVSGSLTRGEVGFMGPKSSKRNPSYEDVCSGVTGHVEVFDCDFTGGAPYYEAMVRFFFQFHDPTTTNKQGNDSGTQYASVIYCYDKEQLRIATKVKNDLQKLLTSKKLTCFQNSDVTTDIRMVESEFFPALDAHQDYLTKNPRVRMASFLSYYLIIFGVVVFLFPPLPPPTHTHTFPNG